MRLRKLRRRGLFQVGVRHRVTHGAERFELLGAAGATRHMRLDVARMSGVELAVDQRMQQDFAFGAVHDTAPGVEPSAPFHAARSIERARASRDITVPTGTPATSAISWYDNSLTSRSTMASRNGCGSAATSRRIVSSSWLAQQRGFRRRLRLLPQRQLFRRRLVVGVIGRNVLLAAPRELGIADVAQYCQQPRFHRRTAIAVEMAQRPQIAFLHRILGVGGVAHEITRQREDVVEIRQRGVAKTPRLFLFGIRVGIIVSRPAVHTTVGAWLCNRSSIAALHC